MKGNLLALTGLKGVEEVYKNMLSGSLIAREVQKANILAAPTKRPYPQPETSPFWITLSE